MDGQPVLFSSSFQVLASHRTSLITSVAGFSFEPDLSDKVLKSVFFLQEFSFDFKICCCCCLRFTKEIKKLQEKTVTTLSRRRGSKQTMFPSTPFLSNLPYSQPFKRAALGLFHGKTKLYGNNVPFSKHKTRRTWLPNSHNKLLYSEIMDKGIRTVVTARVLRTIDKVLNIRITIDA